MFKTITNFLKFKWGFMLVGLVAGTFIILTIRFVTYSPEEKVHYHANFAVYVNGQRELFKSPSYYEETATSECNLEGHEESPLERAHMHGNVNDVVHIEDHLVTWGHFLQNIGWAADKSFVKTLDTMYQSDDQNKITFILNGKKVDGINNQVIGDKDRLLINYGKEAQPVLSQRFDSVAKTAQKYNIDIDPASCGAGGSPDFKDRMKHLF